MNLYWKVRRAVISLKRKIRFWLRRQRRSKLEGMPVYFEDTGERVGVVKRIIRNEAGVVVGYEIDSDGEELYFPSDAFEKTKRGLIMTPLWYSEGIKLVKELELKAKNPDIHEMLVYGEEREKIYENVLEKYPGIRKYIEEVLLLKESLIERLNDLELKRVNLRKEMVDLSGKRLLKEIGRKEFSEKIIEARREMNIVEIGIKRCRELLLRIDAIPFLPKSLGEAEKSIMWIKKFMKDIPVNIVILDDSGKIKSINETFQKNFGYSAEMINGMHFSELMVDGDREKVREMIEEVIVSGDREEEFEFVDKYGIKYPMYSRMIRMDENTNIVVMQPAEEKEVMEKIFSEKIAHLFFNPLSIAQGYIYLLSEEKYGALTPEQKKQIEAVKNSLERIENILKETIKLST
ncbi:MAG: PAS domain S-box protein [Thermoplasmata archaeon]|nr:PAS domain S-box protein [Thermoplasmata archaeon]